MSQITNDDIKYGSREDNTDCPVARCLKREFGDDGEVEVGWDLCCAGGKTYALPKEVTRFIEIFLGNKEEAKPMEFTLSSPTWV